VKPPPLEYHSPATIDEALTLLDELDGSIPLAGGQSLIPLLNLRLAHPGHLVDLAGIASLRQVTTENGRLELGAMTTHRVVERTLGAQHPLLTAAASHVGFPAIRARGTIGGSLAHADPAGEIPLVTLVSDAEIGLLSTTGERTVGASGFFVGPYTTARSRGELITRIVFPIPPSAWGFSEFARRTGDYALVACAVSLKINAEGITHAAVGVAGVADRPIRLPAAESALLGSRPDPSTIAGAAEIAATSVEPLADIHGSGEYRRRLVRTLTARALEQASGRAVHV
jgi:aerobic carbon-monoxide dehydrogenase medium subunit